MDIVRPLFLAVPKTGSHLKKDAMRSVIINWILLKLLAPFACAERQFLPSPAPQHTLDFTLLTSSVSGAF